jgi:uncharacterized protein
MKLEIDLAIITRLAEQKDEENLRFRTFLKTRGRSIDSIVYALYQEVASRIDCQQCANCCRKLRPELNPKDVSDLSLSLGIPVREVEIQYLVKDEAPGLFVFNKLPCPLLKDNLCRCYERRPLDCRSFPHLHKSGFIHRLISLLEFYPVCPIVFNVYEGLKSELYHVS